jgi:phosphotriesterase-related protein
MSIPGGIPTSRRRSLTLWARWAPIYRAWLLATSTAPYSTTSALFRLADSGCVIELDLFGQEQSYYALNLHVDLPNDAERLRWIRRLIDRGHLDQIVISHDICYRSRLTRFGGHGYGHIFENVLPLMRRRGFTEAEIERITVGTPQRLLTFA